MIRIEIKQLIKAEIDQVFKHISNHEVFLSGLPGATARVVKSGTAERDGLGCIREVRVGKRIRYLEEITSWNPPNSFAYLIKEASMPIKHYGSQIELQKINQSTEVTWKSHYEVPVPFIGWIVGYFMKSRYEAAFAAMLKEAQNRLENPN